MQILGNLGKKESLLGKNSPLGDFCGKEQEQQQEQQQGCARAALCASRSTWIQPGQCAGLLLEMSSTQKPIKRTKEAAAGTNMNTASMSTRAVTPFPNALAGTRSLPAALPNSHAPILSANR